VGELREHYEHLVNQLAARVHVLEESIREIDAKHQQECERRSGERAREDEAISSRLRELAQAKLEGETRHMLEMIQLADRTRAHVTELEAELSAKEEERSSLAARVFELERTIDSLGRDVTAREHDVASWRTKHEELQGTARRFRAREERIEDLSLELERLKAEIQHSGEDLEAKASRLQELMRVFEDDVSRAPACGDEMDPGTPRSICADLRQSV
jgi:chromosome segregation ATPase